eukprot:COSAG02_NODE_76_length_41115_cov_60.967817_19_plen_222_part_00
MHPLTASSPFFFSRISTEITRCFDSKRGNGVSLPHHSPLAPDARLLDNVQFFFRVTRLSGVTRILILFLRSVTIIFKRLEIGAILNLEISSYGTVNSCLLIVGTSPITDKSKTGRVAGSQPGSTKPTTAVVLARLLRVDYLYVLVCYPSSTIPPVQLGPISSSHDRIRASSGSLTGLILTGASPAAPSSPSWPQYAAARRCEWSQSIDCGTQSIDWRESSR